MCPLVPDVVLALLQPALVGDALDEELELARDQTTRRNGVFFVVRSGNPFAMSCSNMAPAIAIVSTPVRFGLRSPSARMRRTMSR
jgi:hypothetical protein